MKIVNRQEFLKLPPGTLYAKYVPSIFGPLCIKEENCRTDDWFYSHIVDAVECNNSMEWCELLDLSEETGKSLAMDFDCTSRDGCYEEDQLFGVFERVDVEQLIERLKGTLENEDVNDRKAD